MEYSFHPIAACFPLLAGKELEELKQDIRINGQFESIWVDTSGRIFDGRNRYVACKQLGIEPKFRQWRDDDPPASMIVGLNMHRRHLSASQRAMIAVKVARALEADAKRRQVKALSGNVKIGKPAPENGKKPHSGANTPLAQNCANGESGKTSDSAGAVLRVSGRAVDDAKIVTDKADPSIRKAVEAGTMPVSVGARLAAAPVDVQRKAAAAEKPGDVLKEWRAAEQSRTDDYEGHAIESEAIRAAFAGEAKIEDARKLAVDLDHLIEDICHSPAGVYLDLQDMQSTIAHIKACLKIARPHSLCPKCGGDGCKLCRSVGWVTKEMWERHK